MTAEANGSGAMRSRRLLAVITTMFVVVTGACTDDDDGATGPRAAGSEAADAGATEVIQLEALAEGSAYVQALCGIDLFHPADEEDPMSWLVAELDDLPTTTSDEAEEVAWLIDRVEASQAVEDSRSTDDLSSVAAVLRARCS